MLYLRIDKIDSLQTLQIIYFFNLDEITYNITISLKLYDKIPNV